MRALSKVVIDHLKSRHPTPRLFQRGRWQVDKQRNILVHERLALRGAKDHRMDPPSTGEPRRGGALYTPG
jgi:hypothetical protein